MTFGGLCYLVFRCVAQDSSIVGAIPLEETILAVDMLNFMLDLTKRRQISFMQLIGNIFKSFVKPISINPSIKVHSPTTIKEADSFLLSRVNSVYRNFRLKM